jgi:SAM-dependent methyltransferase
LDDVGSNRATDNEVLWEQHARWWQHTFTDGADPEYEDLILPLVSRHLEGARHVLDIGCGEGQVARRIAELGAEVIGLDPSATQVVEAHGRAGRPRYARARAEALPCRSGAFDAVVACLVFEHVDAIDLALREVARVLEPGGRFVMLVGHPLLQAPRSGWVDDQTAGEHYWRIGAYLGEHAEIDEVAPGVKLRFLHRPVSRYVQAIIDAGLLIDAMEEPAPPTALIRTLWEFPEAATIPRILLLRARRGGEV